MRRRWAVAVAALILGCVAWWGYRLFLARELSSTLLYTASGIVRDHGCQASIGSIGLDSYSPFATLLTGKAVVEIDRRSVPVDFHVVGPCAIAQCDVSLAELERMRLKHALNNCGGVDFQAVQQKAIEAIEVLAASRTHVVEYRSRSGQWPSSLEETGYGPSRERITFRVEGQGPTGRITAEIEPDAVPNFQGGRVILETNDSGDTWACSSPDIRGKFLPAACRP